MMRAVLEDVFYQIRSLFRPMEERLIELVLILRNLMSHIDVTLLVVEYVVEETSDLGAILSLDDAQQSSPILLLPLDGAAGVIAVGGQTITPATGLP